MADASYVTGVGLQARSRPGGDVYLFWSMVAVGVLAVVVLAPAAYLLWTEKSSVARALGACLAVVLFVALAVGAGFGTSAYRDRHRDCQGRSGSAYAECMNSPWRWAGAR